MKKLSLYMFLALLIFTDNFVNWTFFSENGLFQIKLSNYKGNHVYIGGIDEF